MYAPLDQTHLRALVPVAIGGPAPVITPIGRGEFNSRSAPPNGAVADLVDGISPDVAPVAG